MERICGEWKEFEFKSVQEKCYPAVLEHLNQNFYKDEPIQQLVGMTEDRAKDLDKRLGHFLTDNLSFMALEKKTGKIAAVMIVTDCQKHKVHPEFEAKSPLTRLVRQGLIKLMGMVDIFSQFGVDHYADIYVISVSKEFRGKGLAVESYRRAIAMLTEMGYPLIESTFTNPISRKVGEAYGFKEVARLHFADLKDESGRRTMPKATPEQFVNVTVLKLKEL